MRKAAVVAAAHCRILAMVVAVVAVHLMRAVVRTTLRSVRQGRASLALHQRH
jgi:hypothetical protein